MEMTNDYHSHPVELPDWEKTPVVVQGQNMCIAASVEWALRYLEISKIAQVKLNAVEEDLFQFMNQWGGINFGSAAVYLEKNYGDHVELEHLSLNKDGAGAHQKVLRLYKSIESGNVPLISICQSSVGGWHIVPVVRVAAPNMYVRDPNPAGPDVYEIDQIVQRHIDWPGGDDLLILTRKS